MKRFLEIRAFHLKPGTRESFKRLMNDMVVPMLQRWKVDVVNHGSSLHDEDSYYLMRSYASLADRQACQDACYGSTEWRQGPRELIQALIGSHTTSVLELDEAVVDGMRDSGQVVHFQDSAPDHLVSA